KQRIQAAQLRASLAVNRELVVLCWQIGRDILARQEWVNWRANIIDRLAGVYKIKGGKVGKYRYSSGLPVVGLYVLNGLAQRGVGA
ncbi:MAG: DUF1016 family protein, partial [Chloroflexi bacterium]